MTLFEVGPKIKTLRKDKNMTQEELAKVAGISRVSLGKLERGENSAISLKTLDLILDALGMEIAFKSKNYDSFGLESLDALRG